METSYQRFISWFEEFYMHEYKVLSNRFKSAWIKYIVDNNGDYISEDYIQNHPEYCCQCGLCCKDQFDDCEYFDHETNKCKVHDNQPWNICKQYPYGALDMIAPVTINCHYMLEIFVHFFDDFFYNMSLNREDINNYVIKELKNSILTIYGEAELTDEGYYIIISRKEGFYGRNLHKLMSEDNEVNNNAF